MLHYKKYLALILELIGAAAIVAAFYIFFNLAAGLLAGGIMAIIIGVALENSK
jgi:predicted phage tail protein|tara:strand:- start:839 stop:997 length:159 start_codon:yes stop_codon:yes gene_type:complete